MKRPLQIGITGGIGAGKSLVCKIFAQLGVPIYDADSHAKMLMTTDGILIDEIKKEFGNLSYTEDGTLNRKFLAREVFSNPVRLKKLNALVHPRVAKDYTTWTVKNGAQHYLIKEAALLFESGSHQGCNKVVLVSAPEPVRIKRVVNRDKRNIKEIREIIKNQMADEEKQRKADFIILNDESQLVIPQVLELHRRFISTTK